MAHAMVFAHLSAELDAPEQRALLRLESMTEAAHTIAIAAAPIDRNKPCRGNFFFEEMYESGSLALRGWSPHLDGCTSA